MKPVSCIRLTAIAAALALPLAVSAADLKLGFITSLSGPSSSLGIPYGKGLQAGVAYRPDVDGKKVEVIQLDDASDPTTAARDARKLVVEDKVDALIGTAGTPSGLAINGVARELNVPFISIAQAKVEGENGAWMVTVPQSTPLMVDAVVAHMKRNGVKSVAYIGFSDAWGDIVYDALVSAAKANGIKVLTNERYARNDSSVTGQVLKIVAARPDAVLTGTSGTPGALPYLALKQRGYNGKIYGTHGIINPDFIRIGGNALEGLYAPTGPVVVAEQLPANNASRKISLDFRNVYKQTFKTDATDAFAPYAFDAWLIFTDAAQRAMKKAQPGTPQFRATLREAIQGGGEVVGTQGVYNYRADHRFNSDPRSVVMVKLEKGQWKYVP
ncbi:ABC transporter substrate-binding protein [Massilia putida]|uniref:ABC transporter substrate-binding protein n=1 Tax=Massilia putida TaxID=1141883 RepID=UPI000952F2D9|nr:ABC transporter substrate-binding protein [Massilia putida]